MSEHRYFKLCDGGLIVRETDLWLKQVWRPRYADWFDIEVDLGTESWSITEHEAALAIGFATRPQRVDDWIVQRATACRDGQPVAWEGPGLTIFDLFPLTSAGPPPYGRVATAMWTLTDEIYKPCALPGLEAHSIQVYEVRRPMLEIDRRRAFVGLWAGAPDGATVMARCPELSPGLLGEEPQTLARTRTDLLALVRELDTRLNVGSPGTELEFAL